MTKGSIIITTRAAMFASILLILLLGLANGSLAQESATSKQDSARVLDKKQPNKNGNSERILLDKIEIIGSIDRPQMIFILPGQDPAVDDIKIDRSFFQEIFRPVEIGKLLEKDRGSSLGKDYW